MKNAFDTQLLDELEELYLENRQWLSDVEFLEDEARFFRNTLSRFFLAALGKDNLELAGKIDSEIKKITDSRSRLKNLILKHQKLLESMFKDLAKPINVELIEENSRIMKEIQSIFTSDNSIKKKLYTLIEEVAEKGKSKLLLGK